jgi:DNA-binding FadR family transcriptional regulator
MSRRRDGEQQGAVLGLLGPARERSELMRQLRGLLADGALGSGDRLPNERQIAEACGLSRATTRGVLSELEKEGLLSRHVGRGTYVSDGLPSRNGIPVHVTPGELMEFRATVEPTIVDLIVINDEIARRGAGVRSWRDAEAADRLFHETLYAATASSAFGQLGRMIASIRAEGAWMKLKEKSFTPEKWAVYQAEHERIADALHQRDAQLARERLRDHLVGVRKSAKSALGDL